MENSNCCSPNQNNTTNCCPSTETKKVRVKKSIGFFVLGLAFVFAISSAFRTATSANDMGAMPPSIEDFEWMKTDKEVAYVFIKGDEKEANEALSSKVLAIVEDLNETDGSAEYFELFPSLKYYNSFIATIGVETTPSIVVLGRLGTLSIVNSESVSSMKLYKAYMAAITPPASCASSKNCKPSSSCTPAQKAKCATKNNN